MRVSSRPVLHPFTLMFPSHSCLHGERFFQFIYEDEHNFRKIDTFDRSTQVTCSGDANTKYLRWTGVDREVNVDRTRNRTVLVLDVVTTVLTESMTRFPVVSWGRPVETYNKSFHREKLTRDKSDQITQRSRYMDRNLLKNLQRNRPSFVQLEESFTFNLTRVLLDLI